MRAAPRGAGVSGDALHELARAAGIALEWIDFRGVRRDVSVDTLERLLAAMELPCSTVAEQRESLDRLAHDAREGPPPPLLTITAGERWRLPARFVSRGLHLMLENGTPQAIETCGRAGDDVELEAIAEPGYHALGIDGTQIGLAVAPPRAFGIGDLAGSQRRWGLSAQLYGLRREHDGGIGGFGALADLAREAGRAGADALLLSPVHALFAGDVTRFGPYAPSSRLFINPMYADVADVMGPCGIVELVGELGLGESLARLEAQDLVDWPNAGAARLRLLRAAYDLLRSGPLADGRDDRLSEELASFRSQRGAALEDHARFEALHAWQMREGRWSWRSWPAALRDAGSAEVAAFAARNEEDVRFHVFLQWVADRGLAAAHRASREAGMAIGLVSDLAIGTDGDGSHAWCRPHDLLGGVSVGAPPDALNAVGQSWGLTTFSPRALRALAYRPFLETLRTAMRHAGGVRIDHVLGLNRMWLVPARASPVEGAYVRYPLDDLLRLAALESWRHRAIVIGEDLGTVPDGFQDRLASAGVLGMRVLWFHRHDGLFTESACWPREVMATTSTHDVAPVAAWWAGRDLDWRARLGQFGEHAGEPEERAQRDVDREALWNAFRHEGLVSGDAPAPEDPAGSVVDAAVRFVARTPSQLAIVPLEDLAGLDEQPNLPGTTTEHPNWRRRMGTPVEVLFGDPAVAARLESLREERPRDEYSG